MAQLNSYSLEDLQDLQKVLVSVPVSHPDKHKMLDRWYGRLKQAIDDKLNTKQLDYGSAKPTEQELVNALEMTNRLLKSLIGSEFNEWIESKVIEDIIKRSKK